MTPIDKKKFAVFGLNGIKIFLDGMARTLTPEWVDYVQKNDIVRGSVVLASYDAAGTITYLEKVAEQPVTQKQAAQEKAANAPAKKPAAAKKPAEPAKPVDVPPVTDKPMTDEVMSEAEVADMQKRAAAKKAEAEAAPKPADATVKTAPVVQAIVQQGITVECIACCGNRWITLNGGAVECSNCQTQYDAETIQFIITSRLKNIQNCDIGVKDVHGDVVLNGCPKSSSPEVKAEYTRIRKEQAAKALAEKVAADKAVKDQQIADLPPTSAETRQRAAAAGFDLSGSKPLYTSENPAPEVREAIRKAAATMAQHPVLNAEVTVLPANQSARSVVPAPVWTEQIELVRSMHGRNCTNMEFELFCSIAKKYDLDPLIRQIWLVKYGDNPASIFTGRDGFLEIAHRSGMFDGISSGIKKDEDGKVIGWCEVYRKDMSHPFRVEVYQSEFDTKKNLWAKMPMVMITKCAESQCLRRAFSISGLYAPEEMDQANIVTVYPTQAPA